MAPLSGLAGLGPGEEVASMRLFVALALTAAVLAPSPAAASDVRWIQPGPPPIAWDGCRPNTWSTDANPTVVADAIGALSADLGRLPFVQAPQARIRVHWVHDLPGGSTALATTTPNIEAGHIGNADIWVRDWLATWPPIQRLLLHELGHAMGLAHSTDRTDLMWPQVGEPSPPDFTAAERWALATNVTCARYIERGTTVAGPRLTPAVVRWRR